MEIWPKPRDAGFSNFKPHGVSSMTEFGQGTEEIFWNEPEVLESELIVEIHQEGSPAVEGLCRKMMSFLMENHDFWKFLKSSQIHSRSFLDVHECHDH